MTDFSAKDQAGQPLKFNRVNVDAMRIVVPEGASKIHIHYRLLANDLSVRSNHLDESHLHMMPPFTWFLPTSGVDVKRMNTNPHHRSSCPSSWIPATQYELVSSSAGVGTLTGNKGKTHVFTAPDRDELLDGIIEINPNENQTWVVEGRTHHLKLWDSGGHPVDEKMLERFKEDMDRVVKEHHALFGIPKWDNYVTVIQLTEKARGGLEHLNSQTSMLPRQCLMPGHEDEYRDLISFTAMNTSISGTSSVFVPVASSIMTSKKKAIQTFCGGLKVALLGSETCSVSVQALGQKRIGERISQGK